MNDIDTLASEAQARLIDEVNTSSEAGYIQITMPTKYWSILDALRKQHTLMNVVEAIAVERLFWREIEAALKEAK